jgi:peptidoglycan/LPS O-acetylase OafA/YrhL
MFSGGFVGVDVFFVISGYLITTIIVSEIEEGTFSIAEFYVRRARRILPALYFVALLCLPFAWVLMLPEQFKDFAQSLAAISLFSSNVLFWLESGYFALAAETKPLLHTWSLAVEEQYYIFFPLVMMLALRAGRRGAIWVIVALMAFSLALSEVLWRAAPEANFFLLPSRMWELLVGSLCAVTMLGAQPRPNKALALAGLAAVIAAVFVYDKSTPFPSVYAILPVGGAALVILFAGPDGPAGRILASRPAVAIGLISYSAYLWHQPLFAFARLYETGMPSQATMLALCALSLALAWASWRFVERPFRRGGASRAHALALAAAVCIAGVALGGALSVSDLQRQAFYDALSPGNRMVLANIDEMQRSEHDKIFDDGACRFRADPTIPASIARFETCARDLGPAVIVFGDSHSADVYNGLAQAMGLRFIVHVPQNECRPHLDVPRCAGSKLEGFVTAHAASIRAAIYVQAGFWLLKWEDGQEPARNIFATGTLPHAVVDEPEIRQVRAFLEGMNAIVPVIWVGPRIEPHVSLSGLLARPCETGPALLELSAAHREIFDRLDARIADAMKGAPVPYVSEIAAMQFDERQDFYTCQDIYWADTDHWSTTGERRFGPRLAPAVAAPLAARKD